MKVTYLAAFHQLVKVIQTLGEALGGDYALRIGNTHRQNLDQIVAGTGDAYLVIGGGRDLAYHMGAVAVRVVIRRRAACVRFVLHELFAYRVISKLA